MRVTFLHPDLGIGGAERLVVDAALAAKSRGHDVRIVTNHYSQQHCFRETLDLEMKVIDVFPRSFFGLFTALCAYIRMCLAAIYICWCNDADVVFSDQVSASQVVLRLFSSARLLFYCHFPDQLLTTRSSLLKSLYRYFLDALEQWSTGLADVVCVNSEFTASVFRRTFPRLAATNLHVLYPTLNTENFDKSPRVEVLSDKKYEYLFVSVNRFERKKNLVLAIEAFSVLSSKLSRSQFAQCHLVIAGGFDRENRENQEHFLEIEKALLAHGIPQQQMTLLKSPDNDCKVELLRRALAVLYTPSNEHFGIVPLEAMYCETPVLAVDSGGPTESIISGETGFLLDPTPIAFADAMATLVGDRALAERVYCNWLDSLHLQMGRAGRERVRRVFGFDSFAQHLDQLLQTTLDSGN